MKTNLLLLAMSVFAAPIVAYAVTPPTAPPGGFCSNANPAVNAAITVVNIVLALFGYPPIRMRRQS